jgi:hypothetical protein
VKCHTFKKENKLYIQVWKNNNQGANIPAEYLDSLIDALESMRQDCRDILPAPVPVASEKACF